jgi:hypothetical protein
VQLSQLLHDIALLKKNKVTDEKVAALVDGFWDAQRGRFGVPPALRTSPGWLRALLTVAPYFLSRLLVEPGATLAAKILPQRGL